MQISISNHFPIGIKEQIKRQIKALIQEGELVSGNILPSAKEMGAYLKVNRNTVAAAYKELEKEEFVSISRGSGTYINKHIVNIESAKIKNIFDQAFEMAIDTGASEEQVINDFIISLMKKSFKKKSDIKVILIDSNYEVLKYIDKKIKAKVQIDTHFMLIEDIKRFPEKFLKRANEYDLVLCGMNHLDKFKTAVQGIKPETIGVLLKTDFKIMNQLSQIPSGSHIGYCCLSQKSSGAFFKNIVFSSGSNHEPVYAGLDDDLTVDKIFEKCDTIFATNFVYKKLVSKFKSVKKIILVEMDIEPDNLEFIILRITDKTKW